MIVFVMAVKSVLVHRFNLNLLYTLYSVSQIELQEIVNTVKLLKVKRVSGQAFCAK